MLALGLGSPLRRCPPASPFLASPSVNKNKQQGDDGEIDVVRRIACPNCGKRLQQLPPGFPLFDVQCRRCVFRAQVKTNRNKPKDEVFGAGYEILAHFLASGQLIPPLIANFRWREGSSVRQRVIFYPFLTMKNIRRRRRGSSGARPGYEEFNYVGLQKEGTPKRVLLER